VKTNLKKELRKQVNYRSPDLKTPAKKATGAAKKAIPPAKKATPAPKKASPPINKLVKKAAKK
jgi:hypothetical protein